MPKITVSKLVGSLSRALGNDLISYEEPVENVYLIKLWPPISQHNKSILVDFIKNHIPKATVHINKKKGHVKITLRSR